MSIVALVLVIAVLGFAVYLLGLIPMDDTFRKVLRAVAIFILIIVLIVWLCGVLGVGTGLDLHIK